MGFQRNDKLYINLTNNNWIMKPLALMGTASFFVFLWFTLFGMINVLKNKKDIVDSRIKLLKKIFQRFETLIKWATIAEF